MKNFIIFLTISITISVIPASINAQSMTGLTGLFSIPTADFLEDGSFVIGANYQSKKYLRSHDGEYNSVIGYCNFTFLPFLEIGLRSTYPLKHPKPAIGDRMPSLRFKLKSENEYLPAVVLGLHDLGAIFGGIESVNFNSLYIVATKSFQLNSILNNVSCSFGYGSDIITAHHYQFIGPFGGISLDFNTSQFLNSRISLMAEYDAERFNGGVRLTLFDHVNILFGLMGMDSFSGGVSTMWEL